MTRLSPRAALAPRRILRRLVRSMGYDIVPYRSGRAFSAKRAALLAGAVDAVLDVGANTGQYGHELRAAGYRGRIVSFEPLPAPFAELQDAAAADSAWDCLQAALGEHSGRQMLRISRNVWSSSFLAPSELLLDAAPAAEQLDSVDVAVSPLDTLLPELGREVDRLFLKIDVQGYELEVLRGAAQTLTHVVAIEVELSVAPLYERQAALDEVVLHLREAGFGLRALQPAFVDPRSGELLQVDGLFERPTS